MERISYYLRIAGEHTALKIKYKDKKIKKGNDLKFN